MVTPRDDVDRGRDVEVDIVDIDWVADDGSHAGWVRLDVRRAAASVRFLAVVSRAGEDPVVVIDHHLPLPAPRFELRAPGVWVELCCEVPLEHWTVGLEAFGLVVPTGEVVTPDSRGERTPLGLDLDLDTVTTPVAAPGGFTVDVRVHGEVRVADRILDLDGRGQRRRRGDGMRPTLPAPSVPAAVAGEQAGEQAGEVTVGWPVEDGPGAVERRRWSPGGWWGRP